MKCWSAGGLALGFLVGGVLLAQPGDRIAKPGQAVDYRSQAFFPKRWEERKVSTKLFPWQGQQIVFLTTHADLDGKIMNRFLERLDAGWKLYADLVGRSPRPFKQIGGKPIIAAVPDAGLTCGLGCGYIGATGIEVANFYGSDLAVVTKNSKAFPHYYFYEMGRNYYVFGDRHSLFITGYAVFMRYVCMDALGCEDPDARTRKVIEECEERYAASDIPFLKAFTTLDGLDEKAPRLKNKDNRPIHPSDQPVLYAAAMLSLRKQYGGDEWVKRFFAALLKCPEVKPTNNDQALRQALNWLVAASVAARKDLSGIFVERWRLPLDKAARKALAEVDWTRPGLDPAEVIRKVSAP